MENLQHLLILCCYGGVPYIDYFAKNSNLRHESTHTLDPTDWIAIDSSGSLLNATIHPEILAENPHLANLVPSDGDVLLDQCDLFNLTFSSTSDQRLYEAGHGQLTCRCPRRRFGSACQLTQPQFTMTYENASAITGNLTSTNPFAAYILFFLFFMVGMVAVFIVMRGCFCDCFGGCKNPFRNPDAYERPIDPRALTRALEAVRVHEENEKNKARYYHNLEARRPLISSVSEGCAPYNPPVLPAGHFQSYAPPPPPPHTGTAPPMPRSCSPPPSYRSQNGSVEYLPALSSHTKL